MNDRLQQLKALEKESPKDEFILYTIGLELLKSSEIDAELYFEKNRDNNPDYLANYYQLGKLKSELGKLSEAKSIIEEGIIVAKNQKNQHTLNELEFLLEDVEDLM